MSDQTALVLFRNDLRLSDNGAFSAAASSGKAVVAAYIFDQESPHIRHHGGASLWWLHHSLLALQASLTKYGIPLILRKGRMEHEVSLLVDEIGAHTVHWNRRYHPGGIEADTALKNTLRARIAEVKSHDGHLLHEPSRLKTSTGGFYKVFTPFWNALANGPDPRDPIDKPQSLTAYGKFLPSLTVDDIAPLPTHPDWTTGLKSTWKPGEDGAHERLEDFLELAIEGYAEGRDFPSRSVTSMLSPHLAHGEITPYQIFAALRQQTSNINAANLAKFRKEVGWREFCYHLLFHNPELHRQNFQTGFNSFPWDSNDRLLHAWQRGKTGYPIVDAGMRELWQTGTMHNRVRMIAASFLTKHLLIDWREGEKWFWDTLVDADPASNPANWQWVAGCGADAAPYFRIFNPVLQGEKFDGEGDYVRQFVPELVKLPAKYIHKPWAAPEAILQMAGIELGATYPHPIIDHGKARQRALLSYQNMKETM